MKTLAREELPLIRDELIGKTLNLAGIKRTVSCGRIWLVCITRDRLVFLCSKPKRSKKAPERDLFALELERSAKDKTPFIRQEGTLYFSSSEGTVKIA